MLEVVSTHRVSRLQYVWIGARLLPHAEQRLNEMSPRRCSRAKTSTRSEEAVLTQGGIGGGKDKAHELS